MRRPETPLSLSYLSLPLPDFFLVSASHADPSSSTNRRLLQPPQAPASSSGRPGHLGDKPGPPSPFLCGRARGLPSPLAGPGTEPLDGQGDLLMALRVTPCG